MIKFFKQGNKGFTLVETLVAIAIFTSSIIALMAVLANGISDTNYAKKKMTATYLAQEGIEYVRNMRDTSVLFDPDGAQAGWIAFIAAGKTCPSADPNFPCTISMEQISPDEVKIASDVSWTQGSGTYHATFSENLFNWIE